MPELQNTDGEHLRFSKIFFRIKQREGLEEKLSFVKNFYFDEHNKMWVWFKKENKRIKMYSNTTLGIFTIKDGYLIAETNSIQRDLKLKNKLTKGFRQYLSYEKTDVKDVASIPRPSKEDMKDGRGDVG